MITYGRHGKSIFYLVVFGIWFDLNLVMFFFKVHFFVIDQSILSQHWACQTPFCLAGENPSLLHWTSTGLNFHLWWTTSIFDCSGSNLKILQVDSLRCWIAMNCSNTLLVFVPVSEISVGCSKNITLIPSPNHKNHIKPQEKSWFSLVRNILESLPQTIFTISNLNKNHGLVGV